MGLICDDGVYCFSGRAYPKWRILRRKIQDLLWRYLKIDLSKRVDIKKEDDADGDGSSGGSQ